MWGFCFHNVNVASVEKILKNLDVAKASKIEQISARFFKGSAAVIAIHLANVINLPTKVDIFPSQGKIAEIKPLLKLKRLKLKKYRSNFLLPLITKVIEKFIYKQAQDYLQRNELLWSSQSDFRVNHSTDTCLSQYTDMILNDEGNRKHSGVILINPQKVFDNLDHKILLDKIKCIDFSD